MPRRRFSPEEIISKLREAEILLAKGAAVAEACRKLAVTENTYYRWRKEYNQVRSHSSLGYRLPAPEAVHGSPVAVAVQPRKWHKNWGHAIVDVLVLRRIRWL
jgi:transposase-like protein